MQFTRTVCNVMSGGFGFFSTSSIVFIYFWVNFIASHDTQSISTFEFIENFNFAANFFRVVTRHQISLWVDTFGGIN